MTRRILLTGAALVIGLFALSTALLTLTGPFDGLLASVRASQVFSLSNQERKAEGVPQLAQNPLLMRAAQLKAEDMAKESYYAHISPDGQTPMYWLDLVGYKYQYVGENLTANIYNEEQVVSAWMGSPGHKRNLLDAKFTQMGIGVAEGTYKGREALFVVQMLATPKPIALPRSPAPTQTLAPKPVPATKSVTTTKPPAPITENEVVKDVQELTKPITDPLQATSTARIFTSTTTDSVPLVISTNAIPVELRTPTTTELSVPAPMGFQNPDSMRERGRKAFVSVYTGTVSYLSAVTSTVGSWLSF